MKHLLTVEWLKIKKYRTVWILTGLFAFLLPLWNYGIAKGILKIGGGDMNILNQAYSFSYLWQNLGFWTGIFVIFLAVLIIILTTNEYQFRTNRQHIICGWTRMDFYHAKWLVIIILSLLTTLYVFLCGLFFGFTYGSAGSFPGSIRYLFYVWILSLNYYGFGLLLSIFFKRSGITIGIFFLYAMIIESLGVNIINWLSGTHAGNFLPLQSSDELLPFPLNTMIKTVIALPQGPPESSYLLASGLWMALYYFTGRWKLLRSDW